MCALPYILDSLSKYFSGLLKEKKTQPPFGERVGALPRQSVLAGQIAALGCPFIKRLIYRVKESVFSFEHRYQDRLTSPSLLRVN